MRVFTAMMMHETNRFSPISTNIDSFRESTWYMPDGNPGEKNVRQTRFYFEFVDVFRERGHDIIVGPAFGAQPSGLIAQSAYESMRDDLLQYLTVAGPVDSVALFLHGAQMAHGYDDCEGDLLARVRQVVGSGVPVAVLLDLHGNISEAMIQHADIIIAGKEYPHTDYVERTIEVVSILERVVSGDVVTRIVRREVPALGTFRTTEEPLRSLVDKIMALEQGNTLSVSLMHGFPWSDTQDSTANVIVVATADDSSCESLATELASECLSAFKSLGAVHRAGVAEALDQAAEYKKGLVVVADIADNAGGGAPSDSTFILEEMLERQLTDAAIGLLWDPVAVQLATRAGVGSILPMRIGGKTGPVSGKPLDVVAKVKAIECSEGDKKAAIDVNGVSIVLNTLRNQVFTPDVFSDVGIDVSRLRLVVVKSTQHFYHAFAPLAEKVIYCDTPGCISADIKAVPLTRVPRPIWPLDKVVSLS